MKFLKKIHEHFSNRFAVSKTKILILAMAILFSLNVSGQGMPVYDNVNFISFAKQLLEAGKQTSNIIKTMKFLKEQKENIDKVSSAVQQLKAVQSIIDNNQHLFDVMQQDLNQILNSPYIKPDEVNRVTESFNSIVENSLDDLDFIDQILSSDLLKMSDAERAEMLKEKELQSQKMVSDIQMKTKRYRDIISFRKMQDKVNNRETSY